MYIFSLNEGEEKDVEICLEMLNVHKYTLIRCNVVLQGFFSTVMLHGCTILILFQIIHTQLINKDQCNQSENKYSRASNEKIQLTEEEMFKRGHMKPLGSHKPPDYYADVLEYMISPEDFYMNYVVAHKPVVIKGECIDLKR